MSAANYVKNKYIDIIINTLITGIMLLFGFYLTSSDLDAREFEDTIDNKADKSFVITAIDIHEAKENETLTPMRNDIEALKQADTQIRVEFLEQIKMLREDLRLKENKR